METMQTDIIAALTDAQQLGLSMVDEDLGQLDDYQDGYPLTFPAVLVSETSISWGDVAERKQAGDAILSVKLILDVYDDTHSHSGQIVKAQNRALLNHNLTKFLHGMKVCDGQSVLTRTNSQFYTDGHGRKIYETTYSAKVWEDLSEEQNTVTITSIKIN